MHDEISESVEDDSEFAFCEELEQEVELKAFRERTLDSASCSSAPSCEAESESEESDLDSACSMYELTHERQSFVCLNIFILMEYAEGLTLREFIDT